MSPGSSRPPRSPPRRPPGTATRRPGGRRETSGTGVARRSRSSNGAPAPNVRCVSPLVLEQPAPARPPEAPRLHEPPQRGGGTVALLAVFVGQRVEHAEHV